MTKFIALLLICSIFIATASAAVACTNGSNGCTTCTGDGASCTLCSAGYTSAAAAGTCVACAPATYQASTTDATVTTHPCAACASVTTTGATTCFSANIVYGAVLALFALLFWWIPQIKLLEFCTCIFVRVMWRIVLSNFSLRLFTLVNDRLNEILKGMNNPVTQFHQKSMLLLDKIWMNF